MIYISPNVFEALFLSVSTINWAETKLILGFYPLKIFFTAQIFWGDFYFNPSRFLSFSRAFSDRFDRVLNAYSGGCLLIRVFFFRDVHIFELIHGEFM